MHTLDELPLRFWPCSRLPPGVDVWTKMLNLSWFAGGKYGGSGSLAFAAYRVGLPSATHRPLAPDAADYPDCVFYQHCTLFDDPHYGGDFDFGTR